MSLINQRKTSDLPPTIIVHIVRHAQTNFTSNVDSHGTSRVGLSYKGERQCGDIRRTFSQNHSGITHILCSTYKRCIDTARKDFRASIQNGVKIDLMRSLTGHETGNQEWIDGVAHFRDSGSDVGRWNTREGNTRDTYFVRGWLSLKEIPIAEAQKMREVVVVTHEQFLQKLFRDPTYRVFTQGQVGTYKFTPATGALVSITPEELNRLRQEQSSWASSSAMFQANRKTQISDLIQKAIAKATKTVKQEMVKLGLGL